MNASEERWLLYDFKIAMPCWEVNHNTLGHMGSNGVIVMPVTLTGPG